MSNQDNSTDIENLRAELAATREAFEETLQEIYDNTPNPDGIERPDPKMVVATKIAMKLGRCRPIEEVIADLGSKRFVSSQQIFRHYGADGTKGGEQ